MRLCLPILLAGFLAGCSATSEHQASYGLEAGEALVVTDMSGASHNLSDYLEQGTPVVLAFWQTWCESCAEEAPALARAAREHGGDMRFFGVVPGPSDKVDDSKVTELARAWGLSYPQIRDRDLELTRRFDVQGTPSIIILGTDGKVSYQGHELPPEWATLTSEAPEGDVLHLRERRLGAMGTSLEVKVLGPEPARLEVAMDAAVAELQRVEDMMTSWRDSPLTRLNAGAGSGPQEVPPELAELVARALDIGRLTDGAFDVTFAGVGHLWDFKSDPPELPTANAVAAALGSVGWQRVTVDLEANTVDLPTGMSIGLGGIAKGYGVDRAMAVLLEHGIEHGIVDAGGDLKALGRKHGKLWEIAIRHPRDREHVLAVLPISNSCVVTSGDYERFFEHEGKRYHHILDPRTGYPSEGCISATVLAPDAAFADALATALAVVGPELGLELVNQLDRVEALLVGMNGKVHASTGLQGAI